MVKHTLKTFQCEHHHIFKIWQFLTLSMKGTMACGDILTHHSSIERLLLFRSCLTALLFRISSEIFTCLFSFNDKHGFQGSIPNRCHSKVTKVVKKFNENLFSSVLNSCTRFGKRISIFT